MLNYNQKYDPLKYFKINFIIYAKILLFLSNKYYKDDYFDKKCNIY